MAKTTNITENVLEPSLKEQVDTSLINNPAKKDADRISTASKLINRWRWARIGLLAVTFLFYSLYHYGKNKGQPNQNIFKVLFNLPTRRKMLAKAKINGITEIESKDSTFDDDVQSTEEKSEKVDSKIEEVRKKRVEKFSTKETEKQSENSEHESKEESKKEFSSESSEASFKDPIAVSRALKESKEMESVSVSVSEELEQQQQVKETKFNENVRFCMPISEGRFFVQKGNGTFQVVDSDNKIKFSHVPQYKMDVAKLLETKDYWFVATNIPETGARIVLQFDKNNLDQAPVDLLGLNGDTLSISDSGDHVYLAVKENKASEDWVDQHGQLNVGTKYPSTILKFSKTPTNLEERLVPNYIEPDEDVTLDTEKYKFVAVHYPDEDVRVILRYDQKDPVIPLYSLTVSCDKINNLSFENDVLTINTELGDNDVAMNDFNYTAGKVDYLKVDFITEEVEIPYKFSRPEEQHEIKHTGHLVAFGDGAFAVRGTDLSVMEIWKPTVFPDKPVMHLKEHNGEITCAKKIDENIITGSKDSTVIVWNTESGQPDKTFVAGGPVSALAVSSDNQYVAAATESGGVSIWDVEGGVLVKEFDAGNKVVSMDINEHGEVACVIAAKVDVDIPGETWIDTVKIWEVPELAVDADLGRSFK